MADNRIPVTVRPVDPPDIWRDKLVKLMAEMNSNTLHRLVDAIPPIHLTMSKTACKGSCRYGSRWNGTGYYWQNRTAGVLQPDFDRTLRMIAEHVPLQKVMNIVLDSGTDAAGLLTIEKVET